MTSVPVVPFIVSLFSLFGGHFLDRMREREEGQLSYRSFGWAKACHQCEEGPAQEPPAPRSHSMCECTSDQLFLIVDTDKSIDCRGHRSIFLDGRRLAPLLSCPISSYHRWPERRYFGNVFELDCDACCHLEGRLHLKTAAALEKSRSWLSLWCSLFIEWARGADGSLSTRFTNECRHLWLGRFMTLTLLSLSPGKAGTLTSFANQPARDDRFIYFLRFPFSIFFL